MSPPDDDPPSPPRAPGWLTPDEARACVLAYLDEDGTVPRLHRVVVAVLEGADVDADDVLEGALAKARGKAHQLRQAEKVAAWAAAVARREALSHLRTWRRRARLLRVEAARLKEQEAQRPRAVRAVEQAADAGWLLGWFERRTARRPRDRATLDALVASELGARTYRDLAAEQGTNEEAMKKRIQRFRARYRRSFELDAARDPGAPLPPIFLSRRDRTFLAALVLFALVAAAVAWALWPEPRRPVTPAAPLPSVAPAPAPAPPPPFDQALSPPRDAPDASAQPPPRPPRNDKPTTR